ncbi:MAG TPA: ABC transporter permease subunit [Dehalococcoidia bacterium]|nr:ABC transporter permease subunit [Dehalococcoidia bacterium]
MTAREGAAGARIVDRGYQHYTGERRGIPSALRAIMIGTMKRSLGFKRPGSAKVFPFLLVAASFLPFIIVTGLRLLIGDNISRRVAADQLWPYWRYFNWLGLVVLLLAALAASEALCPDRRQRVLSLYYASPVPPLLYLLGQALAVALVLLLVAMLPPLLLWVANVGLAQNPGVYWQAHWDEGPRILASGVLLALLNAALGLAVSAFTERKGYAAGALIGGTIVISIVAGIASTVGGGAAKYALLIDPLLSGPNVARWFLGHSLDRNIAGPAWLAVELTTIAVCAALVVRVYRRLAF